MKTIGIILLVAPGLAFLLLDPLHSHGIVGRTKKNGEGCTCHAPFPSDPVHVWIDGPSRLAIGRQGLYTVNMTGGPAVRGGYNVAAGSGSLAPVDTGSRLALSIDGPELTHVRPRAFINDTVRWNFSYTPAGKTGRDTIYSVGNSVNGDESPSGDAFNFGPDFIVELHSDSSTGIVESPAPVTFPLLRNYPNPFNPSTHIEYCLATSGWVRLSIRDLFGKEIKRLVDRWIEQGIHEITWEASDCSAGVYLCVLQSDGAFEVRKMLLIR